jgi:hypothetical protein
MNSPAIFVERRKHSRVGVMAHLEDITYGVLRKQKCHSGSIALYTAGGVGW